LVGRKKLQKELLKLKMPSIKKAYSKGFRKNFRILEKELDIELGMIL